LTNNGRLASLGALQRRMKRWRDDLGAAILHWRIIRAYIKGHYYAAKGLEHPFRAQDRGLGTMLPRDLSIPFEPRTVALAGVFSRLYPSLPIAWE
jgi:hypothetical protein